ncbi:MAG: methyltransferase domain-containing protein [Alphaproteobacteria bacterium]|nr:methyltransferase domain-containing protein [Alphaproteobacteria bacterium]
MSASSTASARKTHVLRRLRAWWEGYYIEDDEPAPPSNGVSMSALVDEAAERESAGSEDPRIAAAFSDPRVQIMERMFGEGFTGPGGADLIRDLVKPLGLDSSMTVLDIGSGLGGGTRAIHAETGAWVTGYESSPLYVEAAMEMSKMEGLDRKAPVHAFDPEHLELKPNGTNAIFSKDALFTIKNKEALLEAIYAGLKVDGQLLITDYLTKTGDASGTAIDEWVAGEPAKPHLWSLDRVRTLLADLGFEIRVSEDVSDATQALITRSWAMTGEILGDKSSLAGGLGPALLAEAELWLRRMKVLESGQVGAYRIYGRKIDPALRR